VTHRRSGTALKVRRIWTTKQARTARAVALRRREAFVWYDEMAELRHSGLGVEVISYNEWLAKK
jgi:hypothetical protein